MKLFNANAEPEELATFLNRRGFRLDSVSMFITESGFCGVNVVKKEKKYDKYEEEPKKKKYRRIKVFRLEDGESEEINKLHLLAEERQITIIEQISKGTEEGYLVMIDYEEKL